MYNDYKHFGKLTYVTQNYKKLQHVFQNVKVIKLPYCSFNKWYIQVKLSDVDVHYINSFEECINNDLNVKIQKSLNNDVIVLKLPYRYNRFELTTYDDQNTICTIYDISINNILNVDCTHACISKQDYDNVLSTWKVNTIYIKNVS